MDKRINCPVVILSGGKSLRMGKNKALLPFSGYDTLVEYQYRKLKKIFQEVYISTKEDKFDFLNDKVRVIIDDSFIYSPMIALQKILNSFIDSYVFIIAVDIPLLKQETIQTLYKSVKQNSYEIVVPVDSNGNRHNLCGFYHTSLIDTIEKLLQKDIHKIGTLIQHAKVNQIDFNDTKEFLNMNEHEQYKKACLSFSSFLI